MNEGWVRVSKKNPCPCCGKSSWCGISSDGNIVHCMRLESPKLAKGDGGGWIHRLKDMPRERRVYVKPIKVDPVEPKLNATAMMDDLRRQTSVAEFEQHAAELGVSAVSIDALGAAWSHMHQAWAWPMRDALGNTIGIRLRNRDAEKWAVKGSKAGLFYDILLEPGADRILYILEGPTDTAAAITMGLPAVGRHACRGQTDILRALMKARGFNRAVVISDNDEAKLRPDGTTFYPGQEGARALACDLKVWSKVIVTPAKDFRAWLGQGATRAVLSVLEQQQIWRCK